jgi:hypothetical protein
MYVVNKNLVTDNLVLQMNKPFIIKGNAYVTHDHGIPSEPV